MLRSEQDTGVPGASEAVAGWAAQLEDQLAKLVDAAARAVAAGIARRPASMSVFRGVLREIYESTCNALLKKQRLRLATGLFGARDDGSAGSVLHDDPAATGLLADVASECASALWASEGEWGAALQQLFEPVIALRPRWSGGRLVLRDRLRSSRRNAGVYYTPDWIVQLLLDWTQDPRLAAAGRRGLPLPAVYDPACGSGRFLVAALDRLLDLSLRSGRGGSNATESAGPHTAALPLVLGRDIDPLAADLCTAALALQQLARTRSLPLASGIATGDSLLAARLPGRSVRGRSGQPLIVIGNPPFVNAIGRRSPAGLKARYRQRYGMVRGAADTAAYFLAHAAELAGPGGTVGLVLPRSILNSPSAELLRGNLPHGLRPELIWAPDEPFAFTGAAVYFCVVVLGTARHCLFSTDSAAAESSFARGVIESPNWWSDLCRTLHNYSDPAAGRTTRLGDVFEVRAGLTAGEAYELRSHVHDSRDGPGTKLLTTGLIDPGTVLWGSRTCRFLKADYRHPRIADSARNNPRLARRLARAARPKIVVAGLARRLECCLDLRGEFLASVSTLVITHPRDDGSKLQALQEELSAPRSAELVYRELGAHALGGGNITIRKSFLQDYPLLDSTAAWK